MDSYAIQLADEEGTRGPHDTVEEVREALVEYENDGLDLSRVTVWRMTEGGSAGEPVPLSEFGF